MESQTRKIQWKPTKKQIEAWEILNDNSTTEMLFGGAAGGGKSYLGSVWLLASCLKYKGSRWLMGRAVLKHLKDSTLLTFFQVCKEWGLVAGREYSYNGMESTVKFNNGSEIYLKDLFAYPSDPEFDSFGSTEFTGAFIDEGSQVGAKAKNIITARLRFRHGDFGLLPKLLICSNPCKNFLYYDFYKPSQEGTLPGYRKVIRATVQDNPYLSAQYIEQLRRLDKVSRERLLMGNWEYDDDPAKLIEYAKIIDLFTNKAEPSKNKYLTVDVARFGSDSTIAVRWDGLAIREITRWRKQGTRETRIYLEEICEIHQIPRSNVIVDEDGVGGGVMDEMPGILGFINNSRPMNGENYTNLKSQCYYRLAEMVNTGKISCYETSPELKQLLIEDLEQVARDKPDKDGKVGVVPKEKIKEKLGRSTDVGDAIMLRMHFELCKSEFRTATRGL